MMILDLKSFLGWYPWLSKPHCHLPTGAALAKSTFFLQAFRMMFFWTRYRGWNIPKTSCEVQPWTLLNLDTKIASAFGHPEKMNSIRTVNNSPFSNRKSLRLRLKCHFWNNEHVVAGHIRTYNAFSTPGIFSHTKRIMGLETETVSLASKKKLTYFWVSIGSSKSSVGVTVSTMDLRSPKKKVWKKTLQAEIHVEANWAFYPGRGSCGRMGAENCCGRFPWRV